MKQSENGFSVIAVGFLSMIEYVPLKRKEKDIENKLKI